MGNPRQDRAVNERLEQVVKLLESIDTSMRLMADRRPRARTTSQGGDEPSTGAALLDSIEGLERPSPSEFSHFLGSRDE